MSSDFSYDVDDDVFSVDESNEDLDLLMDVSVDASSDFYYVSNSDGEAENEVFSSNDTVSDNEIEVINSNETMSENGPEEYNSNDVVSDEVFSTASLDTPSEVFSENGQEEETLIEPAAKRPRIEEDQDDGTLCPICLDSWTNTGGHRLTSLKCGHLFGHSCILRWITGNKTCPTCKKACRKNDFRSIYANKLIACDTTEIDVMQERVNALAEEKSRIQTELTQAICKQHSMSLEIENYKQKIRTLENVKVKVVKTHGLKYHETINVCNEGSCRIMGYDKWNGVIAVSLKSPNNVFHGFGVRKYSDDNFSQLGYIPLHTKVIRDINFNEKTGKLLSVSLDKTVKILDMKSNLQVGTFQTEKFLWSCCWNSEFYFHVGEQSGSVLKFDQRNLNEPVASFDFTEDFSPVVSIIPHQLGTVVCKINSLYLIGYDSKKQNIPFEGPFTSMRHESETGQILISTRPNTSNNYVRHIVGSLAPTYNFNPVHTFQAGQIQRQMSRPCFISQNASTYIAGSYNTSIGLWSVNTGDRVAVIKSPDPIIDYIPIQNTSGSYLLALSEKKLDFYNIINK